MHGRRDPRRDTHSLLGVERLPFGRTVPRWTDGDPETERERCMVPHPGPPLPDEPRAVAALAAVMFRYGVQAGLRIAVPARRRAALVTTGVIEDDVILDLHLAGSMSSADVLAEATRALTEARGSRRRPDRAAIRFEDATALDLDAEGLELVGDGTELESDLALSLRRSGWHLVCSRDALEGDQASQLLRHHLNALRWVERADRVPLRRFPMLDEAERAYLIEKVSRADTRDPDAACLHELFEHHARTSPDTVAIRFEDRACTYRELNRRANRIASQLIAEGVRAETIVCILDDNLMRQLLLILAVLKAGGAYAVLQWSDPDPRLAALVDSLDPVVLATTPAGASRMRCDRHPVLSIDDQFPTTEADDVDPIHRAVARNLCAVFYTSGSTGRPKEVMIEHSTLATALFAPPWPMPGAILYSLDPLAIVMWGLTRGITALLPPRGLLRSDVEGHEQVIAAHGATHGAFAGSFLGALRPDRVPTLVRVSAGGEYIPSAVVSRWIAGRQLSIRYRGNEHGGTVLSCADDYGSMPSVGRPTTNVILRVLDDQLEPLPVGVIGEIFISGPTLSRGYRGAASATAEKFLPDPFADRPGERMCRTRDRGRWLPNGELEFLGRGDSMIKVRGYRVEPAEVTGALLRHPAVSNAVVIGRPRADHDHDLVAYWVASERGPGASSTQLLSFLREQLPRHMVPSALVGVDAIPWLASGKPDVKALPPPEATRDRLGTEYVAPSTSTECQLAALWAERLGIGEIGVRDPFFDLGGTSLELAQLLAAIRQRWPAATLTMLYEAPTIEQLAVTLDAIPAGAERVPDQALPRWKPGDPLPATPQQRWCLRMHEQAAADNFLNTCTALLVRGRFSPELVAPSIAALVRRHEVFRTVYTDHEGRLMQDVRAVEHCPVSIVDLRHLGEPAALNEARHRAAELADQPFDLRRDVAIRSAVYVVGDGVHLWLLVYHHIALDGAAGPIVRGDLLRIYGALLRRVPPSLPAVPIRHADFSLWVEALRRSPEGDRLRAHWRQRLSGAPAFPRTWSERSAQESPTPGSGGRPAALRPWTGSDGLTARVRVVAGVCGVSPYVVCLGAFLATLHRLSGQDDISVLGSYVARDRPGFDQIVGLILHPTIRRVSFDGLRTCADLLRALHRDVLVDNEHSDLYVSELYDERPDLMRVNFNYLPFSEPHHSLADATASEIDLPRRQTTLFDILFRFRAGRDPCSGYVLYDRHLYDASDIERLVRTFDETLDRVIADPESIL